MALSLNLQTVLEQHAEWLESEGARGRRANLVDAVIPDAQLENANLRNACLRGATLQRANLRGADLYGADLTHCDLSWSDFTGANLHCASLQDSKLRGAMLEHAAGLSLIQLGGALLPDATLPPKIERFETLNHFEQRAIHNRTVFYVLAVACAYSLFAVASASSRALVLDDKTVDLPFLGNAVTITGFFVTSAMLLSVVNLYFNLGLQRMWDELSDLPIVFPDGRSVIRRVYPWLPISYARGHFLAFKAAPRLWKLELLICHVMWAMVPMTLLFMWLLFFRGGHMRGIVILAVLFVLSIGTNWLFYRLARDTLRGKQRKNLLEHASLAVKGQPDAFADRQYSRHSSRPFRWAGAAATIAAVPVFFLTLIVVMPQAIEPEEKGSYLGRAIVLADQLHRAIVSSVLPLDQRVLSHANLQGAQLAGRHLSGDILSHANLRYAKLVGSVLYRVKLDSADLSHAQASEARFDHSKLDGARFVQANLSNATFYESTLRGSILVGADLAKANLASAKLMGAWLNGANLTNANLTLANLKGADLSGAVLLGARMDGIVCDDDTRVFRTKLPALDSTKARRIGLGGASAACDLVTLHSRVMKSPCEPRYVSQQLLRHADESRLIGSAVTSSTTKTLFQGCQSCHDTGLGPSLDGVIGRPAGWLRSFDHYSDEMRSSGLVWNLEQLRQYIANPSALVPGNQMSRLHFDGLQEDETEAVVAHLYSDPRYEFFVQAPLLCVDAAATKFASE